MRITLAARHAVPAFTPLALLYLKAYLAERLGMAREDVRILEFTPASTPSDIARDILATDPGIVALSCYVWNITAFLAACREIKATKPGVLIVLGGPEVGPVGRNVLDQHGAIDIVVKSEGEIPFGEIVRAGGEGTSIESIPGLWCRRGSVVIDTGEAPILQDLNTLPSPHQPAYADAAPRVVCIETQRGCVFRCNFCFYNKDLSIRNRRFDLDRVKREIKFWLERDVQEIYLMDPIFNLKAERAKEICRFIAEHNTQGVKFHTEIWAEFVDAELARLMREANFHFLEVGLQTTDEAALAAVERRLKLAPFLDGIRHLKEQRLQFEVQLIYGLPGENRAAFRRSLEFAAELDPPNLAVYPLMVLPGTELWRKAKAIGLEYDSEPPYFVRSHPDMDDEDMRYGRKMAGAIKLLGDSKTLRLLGRERGLSYAGVMDEWIAWSADGPQEAALDRVPAFIAHVCDAHAIPPDFYQAVAAREFS